MVKQMNIDMFYCLYSFEFNENVGIQMLGEQCESNDECRRTPVDGTKVCSENQCKCSPGHIPIDAYRCIRDFGSYYFSLLKNFYVKHLCTINRANISKCTNNKTFSNRRISWLWINVYNS